MQRTNRFVENFGRGLVLLTLVLAIAGIAQAQSKNEKKIAAKSEEAQKASDVFTEIMNVRDKAVPQGLLDKAEAIAVFPGVVKGGFIIGARGGHGVIAVELRVGGARRLSSISAAAASVCLSARRRLISFCCS